MLQIDSKDFHWFMGVKFGLAVFLFTTFSFWIALTLSITLLVVYRYVIAMILNIHVMESGDLNTFITNSKAPANVISSCPLSIAKPEYAREVFSRLVKSHIKGRSRIVKVLGDMYY